MENLVEKQDWRLY